MLYTLTFCYVSPETRDTVPLLDNLGRDITMQVEFERKSDSFTDPWVENFCRNQGNDCRIRGVS